MLIPWIKLTLKRWFPKRAKIEGCNDGKKSDENVTTITNFVHVPSWTFSPIVNARVMVRVCPACPCCNAAFWKRQFIGEWKIPHSFRKHFFGTRLQWKGFVIGQTWLASIHFIQYYDLKFRTGICFTRSSHHPIKIWKNNSKHTRITYTVIYREIFTVVLISLCMLFFSFQ